MRQTRSTHLVLVVLSDASDRPSSALYELREIIFCVAARFLSFFFCARLLSFGRNRFVAELGYSHLNIFRSSILLARVLNITQKMIKSRVSGQHSAHVIDTNEPD